MSFGGLWGPIGAAIILAFVFVEDTTYDRRPDAINPVSPKAWVKNRMACFLPGLRMQASGRRGTEVIRRAVIRLQITISPISLLVGSFIFISLSLPITQGSTLATYLLPPTRAGGYGFSTLDLAFFTFSFWIGIISAQVFDYFVNDKISLWLAERRKGVWHPGYRLANTILPGIILPIGLGLFGANLEYYLHFMVLAVASFLVWFAAMLLMPICYNYIMECFLHYPVEASVYLNACRVRFGLIAVSVVTQWQEAVGVGWMWGMGAFFIIAIDVLMVWVILKGHSVRELTMRISKRITGMEDETKLTI